MGWLDDLFGDRGRPIRLASKGLGRHPVPAKTLPDIVIPEPETLRLQRANQAPIKRGRGRPRKTAKP